ncbi:hypothetical protein V502_05072 [Pseudogymnoascus sp. VKM F-4520 (FW-2644)]|nr:hypothetical protein V502_05072 [Pseudogymnoascus sp. VKM F-4520 (FW-2644)]
MAIENANPTIINVDELPTRRGKPQSLPKEDQSILSLLAPIPNPALQIYLDGEEPLSEDEEELAEEPIDEQEIYDLISTISDPEHPLSLGSLAVVNLVDIFLSPPPALAPTNSLITVTVLVTPTITHCSLATVIGLGVRVRLEQALPPRYRVDVRIKPGTHSQDEQVNKQLADKERVAAALENATLLKVLMTMLETCV